MLIPGQHRDEGKTSPEQTHKRIDTFENMVRDLLFRYSIGLTFTSSKMMLSAADNIELDWPSGYSHMLIIIELYL